jgi:ATP-dependent RNA helicase DDX19/DBP5
VIGTPGKLKNWMSSKPTTLDPKHIKVLVFDEADQMFDSEGFLMDSTRMVKKITEVSKQCQILLFSATFSDTVRAFAVKHVRRANQVRPLVGISRRSCSCLHAHTHTRAQSSGLCCS